MRTGALIVVRLVLCVLFAAVLLALLSPTEALAVDRTFAGSAQVDYFLVPTEKDANAHAVGFDGFTTEAAVKLAVDISDHLSANVKVCFGCHGFEADMAYFDYRFADEVNVRFGRFSPSFGSFNLRHDPANQVLSDKPLPYDMGRMLRRTDWNNGVLPAPFPDNGVEVNGTHWFGEKVQLDYAAYGVGGFRGDDNALDLDFVSSRSVYYVDNDSRPTVGARAALTAKLGRLDTTLGASGMYGTFDPANKQTYAIFGSDLSFRYEQAVVRLEYLARRETFDTSDPTLFKYDVSGKRGNFFVKHGAFAEIEEAISSKVTMVVRADGMYRVGNVAAESTLREKSSVLRFTLGSALAVERGLRLKASTEVYRFSDADVNDKKVEVGFHLAAVGTF